MCGLRLWYYLSDSIMMSTPKQTFEWNNPKESGDKEEYLWTTKHILVITTCVLGTIILVFVLIFCYKKCCKRRGNNKRVCCNHIPAYVQRTNPFADDIIATRDFQCGVYPSHEYHRDFQCGVYKPQEYHRGNHYPLQRMSSNTQMNDYTDTQDNTLKDLYKETERSFTQTVCGKLLVSVARQVEYDGGVLYLDNMGISLRIPEGAVKRGERKWIALVLNWDLSDNPEMKNDQSLVSPVVYVGPHGLKLEKRCTLIFRHCAFNRNQIRVMRSETELTQQKAWEAVCDQSNTTETCNLTADECQLNIETFTLYTCIQTPLDNTVGKKWLQIAVFACPLRSEINHHQVRVYFLNKTNCALQWAIQNEAKFGGKLVCPEKVFLFDGNELDMFTETKYMSDGWELVDLQKSEKVSFIKIWHGQCPYISVCFRRSAKEVVSRSAALSVEMSLHVFTFQHTLEENGEKIFIQLFEDDKTPFTKNEIRCNHQIQIQINNYKDNDGESTLSQSSHDETESGRQLALNGMSVTRSDPQDNLGKRTPKDTNNFKFVINNRLIHCPPETDHKLFSDVSEPRLFPHDLRKRLVLLLDPPKCPYGQDWKDLATKLGLDACIPKLETVKHPTSELLNVLENQGKTHHEVLTLFREIDRMDCVEEIMKYSKRSNVKSNSSSREPSEHTLKEDGDVRLRATAWIGSYNGNNLSSQSSSNNNSATLSKSVNNS